eukprot:10794299-Heterocapsa_arctica.AAC.1
MSFTNCSSIFSIARTALDGRTCSDVMTRCSSPSARRPRYNPYCHRGARCAGRSSAPGVRTMHGESHGNSSPRYGRLLTVSNG